MGNETNAAPHFSVTIAIPVYRDWECVSLVCRELDRCLSAAKGVTARVLVIDDGSPEGTLGWKPFASEQIASIDVLRLERNLGHQRAIAAALCYVFEHVKSDAVLIMDGDGEDRPEDAVRLIERIRQKPRLVIFAERRKRLETVAFRVGYLLFRLVHRVLTGIPVRVGNFSVVPFPVLGHLVRMPELWNHYAGAVLKSKVPSECIPMDRGKRLLGTSHMNGVALVAHGLAGIATFYDVVATRILLTSLFSVGMILLLIAVTVAVRLTTDLAVPGWATYTSGLLLVVLIQVIAISFSMVFTLIAGRSQQTFIPIRDYGVFVAGLDRLPTQ